MVCCSTCCTGVIEEALGHHQHLLTLHEEEVSFCRWKFVLTETSPPQSAIKQDPATSKRKSIEPHTSAEEAPGRQTSVEPASAEAKRPRTADGTGHSALYAENANLRKQLEVSRLDASCCMASLRLP